MSNQRFETLDAIRGLAAILVIPRHTIIFGDAASAMHSYLAVDLFFILSGFVIAHAYDAKIVSGAMSAARFMLARLVRLYPLFLLAALLAIAVAATRPEFEPNAQAKWTSSGTTLELIESSLLTLAFVPSRLGDSVLLIVNLLYVAFRRALSRRVLLCLIVLLGLSVAYLGLRGGGVEMGWSWGIKSIASGLLRSSYGFAMGLLLYRIQSDFSIASPGFGCVAVLALAIIPLLMPDSAGSNGVIDDIAVLFVFPAAVLLGAKVQPNARLLGLFAVLGTISYPIYLLHVPFTILLERLYWMATGARLETVQPWGGLALLVLLIAVALLASRYYDIPVRQRIANWLRRREAVATNTQRAA
jgi:peptidoglycan/LPS O-acetylase OafA/YrhL